MVAVIYFGQKGKMKRVIKPLVIAVAISLVIYFGRQYIPAGLDLEIRRYADAVETKYITISVVSLLGSYLFGYIYSKSRTLLKN